MLKCLMALALGEYGRPSCDGVPVGAAMNLLSKCFAQAAVDADKLTFARSNDTGSSAERQRRSAGRSSLTR